MPRDPPQERGCWGSPHPQVNGLIALGQTYLPARQLIYVSESAAILQDAGGVFFLVEMDLLRVSQEERMWKDGVQWVPR